MSEKLKPCPFCNNKPEIFPHIQRRSTKGLICYMVAECTKCGARITEPHNKSSKVNEDVVNRLIQAWNKRAECK